MKTLNRHDERFIMNYIHKHPMQWTMYRMGGRMNIVFNLDKEIERLSERVESYKNSKTIQRKFLKMNNDSLKFFKLLKEKFGDEHDSALEYWKKLGIRESKVTKQYRLRPIIERKDNKNSLNYGSGSSGGSSSIRYPKKNRKTAWKRFFKLFPHLDPNNKKD